MESGDDLHETNPDLTDEQKLAMRGFTLNQRIKDQFKDASAVALRRWYVDTFVLDSANRELLPLIKTHKSLVVHQENDTWISREHSVVGTRLLYEMDPDAMVRPPSLTEPDHWRSEVEVAKTIVRVFEPWKFIRYDPEGENWYGAIDPGQWQRHGKGKPSQQFVEGKIMRWLDGIDPNDPTSVVHKRWPYDTNMSADMLTANLGGSVSAFKKFKKLSTTMARVREVLERMTLMHIDTTTLNQIRTMTPFSNGALSLVRARYWDTLNQVHNIEQGQLLPLDIEYMVTNANSLPWLDTDGAIAKAGGMPLTMEGDFVFLDDVQDGLLLRCPTYWSFLTHAFPEIDERSAFLRLLGAAMYGTNIKIVAAMIGEPNAGKDTIINWLSYLMPGQVATLPFSAFTPHGDEDRGFAPLMGARVATVSGEVGDGRGSKLLAEKIKTVSSGGGKIRVAEKYEKPTDIWFDGMLFLQGNSVPQISGGDRALYTNRLVAVEFNYPFMLVSRSYEDAYRREAPWFAQVLFLNYIQYLHNGGGMPGIDPPKSWRSFAREFADAANPHGFLESAITPSETPIPTHQFHQALSAMADRFGSPFKVGPNFWPKRLRALGYHTKGPQTIRKQVQRAGVLTWCYYLTVDADLSDGAFTQMQWDNTLKDAAVTS